MNQFYYLERKYKLLFAQIVHKFFEMYKVISNYLRLNAGNASNSGLLGSPATHSAVSSLFWLTKQKKNRLHYTLNTPHQTLYDTIITHSKHATCHKSLNSHNSLSLSPSLPHLPLSLSNQITWFIIRFCDWLVWWNFPAPGMRAGMRKL